jgi:hypothetical protein
MLDHNMLPPQFASVVASAVLALELLDHNFAL